MSYLNVFRLRVHKITSVLLVLFIVSFSLHSLQDLSSTIVTYQKTTPNQQELKQSNLSINSAAILDDDDDVTQHHQIGLIAPCLFLLSFFFYSIKGFFEIKHSKLVDYICLQVPSSGLFLSNQALII